MESKLYIGTLADIVEKLDEYYTPKLDKSEAHSQTLFVRQKGKKDRFEIHIKSIYWNQQMAFALIFINLSPKDALRALKIADDEKEKVISTVTHELRTPINGMLGLLDLL